MRIRTVKKVALAGAFCLGLGVSAETVAYWQFQDGAPGTTASKGSMLKTLVNAPALDASVSSDANVEVGFSSDVPGKVIVCGKEQKVVNAENRASVKALRKTGGSEALNVAGNQLLQLDDFTFEAFVKLEEYPRWGRLFWKNRSQGRFSWILSLKEASGLLRGRVDSNPDNAKNLAGFNQGINTPFKLDDKQWHHVAFSYDGLTQEFAIYADYQLQAKAKTALPMIDENLPISIFGGAGGRISALVDEVRISNMVLLPEEFLKVK
jgi:hypothetical protein